MGQALVKRLLLKAMQHSLVLHSTLVPEVA
jgi:hypothetical protein